MNEVPAQEEEDTLQTNDSVREILNEVSLVYVPIAKMH